MANDTDEPRERREDEQGDGTPSTVAALDEVLGRPELRDASDVLVLGPMRRSLDDDVCRSFLCAGDGGPQNLLVVSLTLSARNRLEALRELGDDRPPTVTIVSATEEFRASTTETAGEEGEPDTVTVETVADPSDLTRLGLTISGAIAPWRDDGRHTRVCFHSLTALLQYADPQRTFRFLHILQQRLAAVDAVTHYHMDADAHDEQTVATLRTLFDAVVEVSPDGDATLVG